MGIHRGCKPTSALFRVTCCLPYSDLRYRHGFQCEKVGVAEATQSHCTASTGTSFEGRRHNGGRAFGNRRLRARSRYLQGKSNKYTSPFCPLRNFLAGVSDLCGTAASIKQSFQISYSHAALRLLAHGRWTCADPTKSASRDVRRSCRLRPTQFSPAEASQSHVLLSQALVDLCVYQRLL